MKRLTKWLAVLLGVAALAAVARAQESEDVWMKMNEDVQIMRRLVADTLSEVRSPRVEEIDKRLAEIREQLTELEKEYMRDARRRESTEGARLRSEPERKHVRRHVPARIRGGCDVQNGGSAVGRAEPRTFALSGRSEQMGGV